MPADQESLVLNNGPSYLSCATDFSEQARSKRAINTYCARTGVIYGGESD